jgi:hypothetical protein
VSALQLSASAYVSALQLSASAYVSALQLSARASVSKPFAWTLLSQLVLPPAVSNQSIAISAAAAVKACLEQYVWAAHTTAGGPAAIAYEHPLALVQ